MGSRSSTFRLSPEALNELVESTNFTEDELRHWYRDFCADFPSGRLSIDQLRDVCSQRFRDNDACARFAEHVLRTSVREGDDLLDFRQFICALSVLARGSTAERLRWAYSLYDVDEMGTISREQCGEVIKGILQMRKPPTNETDTTVESHVDRVFASLGKQAEKVLSEEDFVSAVATDSYLAQFLSASEPQGEGYIRY